MRPYALLLVACASCVQADVSDDPIVVDETGKEDGAGLVASIHVALGAPKDGTPHDDRIFVRAQYVNSYNEFRNGPNWVAWHLTASDVGTVTRQNDFHADTALPAGWYRVAGTDYDNQGYDRGHMCDSEDRSSSVANNQATFLMSNMLPQRHTLNAGPWQGLEIYGRTLAAHGWDLFIISGGAFSPACDTHAGIPPSAECPTIGAHTGRIAVPDTTWKVIVVVPTGGSAKTVTASSRVIAVDMPNETSSSTQDWTPYLTTVEDIELKTGYHFFAKLPAAVQQALRTQKTSPADTQLLLSP